jgi:hypothetical protein
VRILSSYTALAVLFAVSALAPGAAPVTAQTSTESWPHASVLQRENLGLYEALIRLERTHGALLGQLALEGEAVRMRGDGVPTTAFESGVMGRMTALVSEQGPAGHVVDEAAAGYAVLGAKGAEVMAWGNAFSREVLGILIDPTLTDPRAALSDAVERYQSRPDIALPSGPKDMDVLYDHPYALAFRERYPDLAGLVWAGHWLKLAATEPLTDLRGRAEQGAGLDTVATRYRSKLRDGEPPQSLPSQIPLAPAIAPGFIFESPEAAMIWDNLSLLQETLADILASPAVPDVRAALDEAIENFLDPTFRMSVKSEWESMALHHGIFFQGGYPLAVMTKSELNGDPHAAHRGAAGGPIVMPGGPG